MNVVALCSLVISLMVIPAIVKGDCNVVPIEQWAGVSSGHVDFLRKPVDLVVVTHTVTQECKTDEECEAIANGIRNFQKEQGQNDIGLSFLIGGNGKIYEGAGWRVGTHTRGFNDKAISISYIGDYRDVLPTTAALSASQQLLACFVNKGFLGLRYTLVGHRQLIPTISPGDALQDLIQTWPHWSRFIQTRPH